MSNRPLRVFLCHASVNKPEVQRLYSQLVNDGVDAWLDNEKLIPGQSWGIEIPKAVRNADVVIVCLSSQSVNKEGYVQKEIKIALDTADEKPEGTIFIIPARLETCNVPERLAQFHWVDLFSSNGYVRLIQALQIRANTLDVDFQPNNQKNSVFSQGIRIRSVFSAIKDIRIITVSGQSCSGKTTLANEILQYLPPEWKKIQSGFLFREFFIKNNYFLEDWDFGDKIPTRIYRQFDEYEMEILRTGSKIILDGQITGYLAYKSKFKDIYKIFCNLPLEHRIKRFKNREIETHTPETLRNAEDIFFERHLKDIKHFKELYREEDYRDKKYYNLYLDTTKTPEELTEAVFLELINLTMEQ